MPPDLRCSMRAALLGIEYRGVTAAMPHKVPTGCVRFGTQTTNSNANKPNFVHYVRACESSSKVHSCESLSCSAGCTILFPNSAAKTRAIRNETTFALNEFPREPLLNSSNLMKKIRSILQQHKLGHNSSNRSQHHKNMRFQQGKNQANRVHNMGNPESCMVQKTPASCIRAGPALSSFNSARRCSWSVLSKNQILRQNDNF